MRSEAFLQAMVQLGDPPARWLLVDAATQSVSLLHGLRAQRIWPVSTAAAGLSACQDSGGTPPGLHRIARKIGAGLDINTVFSSREPTGEIWDGRPDARDLILGRILTLEGCQAGVNRGPGVDSLERYIYLHGTNHEDQIGEAQSGGCVRLCRDDIAALFDLVEVGDPVVIVGRDDSHTWLHFVGVAGSGMSALAQFHVGRGGRATGSDRAFDKHQHPEIRAALEASGVVIVPQDGRALGPGCAAVVSSTAVESQIPDLARARELGLPIRHRSELLAVYAARHRTIAVTGTSGKSTTTAMIWTILDGCGRDPRLLTGGSLIALQERGLLGNAWSGAPTAEAELLVIEADESDGTVIRYHPWAGVVLNLARDHKEIAEVAAMFTEFRLNCHGPLIVSEDANLDFLRPGAVTFGFGDRADVRGRDLLLEPSRVIFTVGGARFVVPWPGRHTALNALAAIAVCLEAGVDLAEMAAPLAGFRGVERRFVCLGKAGEVEVIDDFAHNPDKLRASIRTARERLADGVGRVLAIFQPHGFGPTRFLRADLVAALADSLRPVDILWLPEIFYAGGTVARDLSSFDLVRDLSGMGRDARFCPKREDLPQLVVAEARPGDVVLVMGARDPSLTGFCREILGELESASGTGIG